jgi:hypothetical protein
MYVLLYVGGVILCIFALLCLFAAGFLLVEDGDLLGLAIAVLIIPAAVGGVLAIRQGSWVYAEVECDGVAEQNPELNARRTQITFWDFGCYVEAEDGVIIPWDRYRAVVEG